TGEPLVEDLRRATSAWARFRGLMLAAPLPPGGALKMRPCGSIHMMFMRFAIDAVFFDEQLRVTKVGHRVRPWIGLAFGGRGGKGGLAVPGGGGGQRERGR